MIKKVGNVLTTLIMVILFLLVGIMYVPKVFGITPMVVLSGSMEPTYKVGSLIFAQEVEPSQLEVGDNVTFYLNQGQTVVTHRIVELNKEAQTMNTKGDNNNVNDGEQALSSVIGRASSFTIPFLGYLATYLSTGAGLATLVVIVIACLLLSHFLDRKKDDSENEEE